MEQNIDIQVDPYIEAGNVIYPSFHLSLQLARLSASTQTFPKYIL